MSMWRTPPDPDELAVSWAIFEEADRRARRVPTARERAWWTAFITLALVYGLWRMTWEPPSAIDWVFVAMLVLFCWSQWLKAVRWLFGRRSG